MDHAKKKKKNIQTNPIMEPRLDRISALPDDLLVGILERLSQREALRAAAASTRWRHLPHQLSRLVLATRPFQHRTRATPRAIFQAFACAAQRFLSAPCPRCEQQRGRRASIKTIRLYFYVVLDPDLMSSVGHAVDHVVSLGETERLEFGVFSLNPSLAAPKLPEYGQQLMSFSRACPVAFRWLTTLTLQNLAFGGSDDIGELVRACHKLEHLKLVYCNIVAPLKIDAPSSQLHALVLRDCGCTQVQLISLPKLSRLVCHACLGEEPLVHFGHDLPWLRDVYLSFAAPPGEQTQLTLSELLLPRNMSILRLSFRRRMIWIQLEHPKRLIPIFSNVREVYLYDIFSHCDLNWTLFFLEAAPSLQKFHLSRHSCVSDVAEKTNMSWEPSKNSKHLKLRLMVMVGFLEENQAMLNYVRLVMERATCLERIKLITDENCCPACNDILTDSPTKFIVDEAGTHRVRERLRHGLSSHVQIILGKVFIREEITTYW